MNDNKKAPLSNSGANISNAKDGGEKREGEIPPYKNQLDLDILKRVNGIHVNSTLPFFVKSKNERYYIEKAELYSTIISALNYRKYCGNIFMITDKVGKAYYEMLGFQKLWNGLSGILPSDLEGINPEMFWAAGKLLALRSVNSPVAVVDTDFMVWEKPKFGKSVIAAHKEALTPDIYPPREYFRLKNYTYPDNLCWNDAPLNTAFLYLPDESFKQYYVSESITFMKSAMLTGDKLCYMVFAEQRLLPMLCRKWGTTPEVLLDKSRLSEEQSHYSHVWGAKAAMRTDKELQSYFIERCKARIRNDYPSFAYLIDNVESNCCV